MIDLGHPFSKPYQELIESLEENIRQGVEQPALDRFIFQSTISAYELRRPAHAISRVSGLLGGVTFKVFEPGLHYRFSNNRIIWLHETEKPLDGSRLEVEYTYRERPAALTDFNPGSVVGTLVRAVARELKLLYEQMDQAYRRAFIDEANGAALDNVTALLGVSRNPAILAQGHVTFFRKRTTNSNIRILAKTRVTDESGRVFETAEVGEIEPARTEIGVQEDGRLKVRDKIAAVEGIWREGDNPPTTPSLPIQDTASNLPFGEDERTITLASGVRPTERLQIRYNPKSVTIPITAVEAGPAGNVNAGAIVIMPTPPPGVDGVINEEPVSGGLNAETDEQLRERAKHALERSGNATLNAIKFAVLDVDGVEGVEVVDHSLDDTVPLGEVRVRYSGGDPAEVQRVVEQTRAAGILARLEGINQILISGVFYVIPDVTIPETAASSFLTAVIESIEALEIGQPLSVRRLNALVYQSGLADVAEAQLHYQKEAPSGPGDPVEGDVTDPFLIERTEVLRPDKANLQVRLLAALNVAASRLVADTVEIDLQVTEPNGAAVAFKNFSLDIHVTLAAVLLATPDQPAERVSRFTRTITFNDAALATLIIGPADRGDFDPAEHNSEVNVAIGAAAYPGLQKVQTTVNLEGD